MTMVAVSRSEKKAKLSARERRRVMQDWLLLSPQLILYGALLILPFFFGLPILFTNRNNFTDLTVRYTGFENFTRVFTDHALRAEFLPALQRTVLFTIINYLMVYVFGLALALLMYDIGFRGGLFTMIYMPAMISGLAVGFIATLLFSESTGIVNLLFVKKLAWLAEPINIKTGTGTTVVLPVLIGWRAAGFNMAIFLSGLLSIPKETIEASIVDGATYWQRLWRIYFPQMIPSFLMATIYCMTGSFKVFDQLVALGGLGPNDNARFLSIIIFEYGFSRNRLALGMALSLEVFLPLSIGAVLLQRLQRRFTYQV